MALYVEATVLAGARSVLVGCCVLLVLALPAETAYGFKRLFAVDGTSGLPVTLDQSVVFDWIDRTIGPDQTTVMIPYPVLVGDYFANLGYWWDLEFWNRSVTQEAWRTDQFSGTPPGSFPKLELRFDPFTGLAQHRLRSARRAVASGDALPHRGHVGQFAAGRHARPPGAPMARRLDQHRALRRRLDEAGPRPR